MLRVAVILLIFSNILNLSTSNKAPFLFPRYSVFQFTIGISVPFGSNKRGSIVSSFGYQFNYALPWNITQFQEPGIIPARDNHDFNLNNLYTRIEQLLDTYGWTNGRECLLRSICEIAEIPFSETKQDIFTEIIHLLLTPTGDLPEAVNSSHQSVDKLYHEAEVLGRSGGDCILTYPDCIESPLESFTKITWSL